MSLPRVVPAAEWLLARKELQVDEDAMRNTANSF